MVTMLDCIRRVPERLDWILENREETFRALRETLGERLVQADEIVLVGSGTSLSSALTARFIAERAAGIAVNCVAPADFLYYRTAYNPKALYVFISQTGTSTLTRVALAKVKQNGWMSVAVSESADTPAAREAQVFVNMGCGPEEYPMRTIGYSTSVLTLSVLGMEVGRLNGKLSGERDAALCAQARAASAHIPEIIEKSLTWMDHHRRKMLRADCLVFTGSGPLAGVAQEASIKVWETPQITTLAYELEEGLHAPNFGYNHRHCLIVLNDGGREDEKALAICKYMKNELQNGFLVGAHAIDGEDLSFDPQGGWFAALEFAAAMQVLNYRLAVDQGRDLINRGTHGNMGKYFSSHRDLSPEEMLKDLTKEA